MNTATTRRWASAAIAVAVGGLLIYILHPVLVPLLIALVFAYLLDPVVESLAARRVPRPVSSISIMALAAGILILILLWLIPAIGREIQAALADLPRYSTQIATYAKPYIERLDHVYPGGVESLTQKAIETARANAPKMMAPLATFVTRTFSSIVNLILGLLNLILIPIMTYFLLRDIQKLRSRFYELIPPRRRKGAQELLREIEGVLNAFVRGQLTVCTILAVMYGIGLSLLGVPMALFWALLGGYGNLIPYVGTITSASGAMLFSFMHHHDLKLMAMTGGVFVLAQTLEGTVIGPRIVGDSVGLNPVIVMLAVITGGNLFGFIGMLLAVPTVAVCAVILKHGYARYVKSEFYKAH
ncbi:MAG: AI-2E family transporter [Acidobacteria bacterium]|nr:AI-2E family transporter [Acidobacteriota bacterium]